VATLGARETGQAAPLPRDAARADRRRLAHLALLAAPQIVALPCSHAERLGYGSVGVTDTTFRPASGISSRRAVFLTLPELSDGSSHQAE